MLRHYFLTTIRTLRQNMLYTALSVFGIALTFVFVSILLLFVKSSKGDYIPPKYTERTWQIRQYEYQENERRFTTTTRKKDYELLASKMKTPEMIVGVISSGESVVLNDQNMTFMILGVTDNYFEIQKLKFLHGRPLNKQEIAESMPVAVIDRNTADLYFGKNTDPTGKNIELFAIQYRILGVVENVSFLSSMSVEIANIWIPFDAVRNDNQTTIYFTAKNKASIADMQAEFTRVLNESNTIEGATQYNISDWQKKSLEESTSFFNSSATIMILLILMLIPALNILSLNISKSHERSEEIAVRKAFGAPWYTIFGQLFIENTMITLVGAVIGMCVTPFLVQAIDRTMLDTATVPLAMALNFDLVTLFMVAVPSVLLFSFLSGSIPAWIIAKKDIVNVLKGEIQ